MLLLSLLALFSLAAGLEAPLPGHDVQEQVWRVPITPGGPLITVNGTVQQLFSQLSQLNPDFEAALPPQARALGLQRRSRVAKRYVIGRYSCGSDFYSVPLGFVDSQDSQKSLIAYLDRVPGSPSMAPTSCARVSCEQNLSIWWCNHDVVERRLDSFKTIAEAVRKLISLCYHDIGKAPGQIEYTDGWSVIYRGSDSC